MGWNWMIFNIPFQPEAFYDSIILKVFSILGDSMNGTEVGEESYIKNHGHSTMYQVSLTLINQ